METETIVELVLAICCWSFVGGLSAIVFLM
jgi:hypothetical protein